MQHMISRRSSWTLVAATALALVTGFGAGCGTESNGDLTGPADQETAPELPPVASLSLDFSRFETEADPAARLASMATAAETGANVTQWHWWNAVLRVALMNVAVAEALTPPAAALEAAFSVEPVRIRKGVYEWTYSWSERGGREVSIRLRGEILAGHTAWQLRVSDNQSSPVLDDALWFAGETRNLGREGFWSFYDAFGQDPHAGPGDLVEVAHLDWVAYATESELRLTATDPASEDVGDSLVYSAADATITVVYSDASEGETGTISWNERTGVGFIEYPDYNDGERGCWDEEQVDVDCEIPA